MMKQRNAPDNSESVSVSSSSVPLVNLEKYRQPATRVKMREAADGSLKSFDSNIAATDLRISLAEAQPTTGEKNTGSENELQNFVPRLQNRPKVTTLSLKIGSAAGNFAGDACTGAV
eukprot:8561548-Pyramimonas_sp.AAC.1